MCKDEKLHQELSTLASLFTVYYVRSPQARAIEMILWKLGLKTIAKIEVGWVEPSSYLGLVSVGLPRSP